MCAKDKERPGRRARELSHGKPIGYVGSSLWNGTRGDSVEPPTGRDQACDTAAQEANKEVVGSWRQQGDDFVEWLDLGRLGHGETVVDQRRLLAVGRAGYFRTASNKVSNCRVASTPCCSLGSVLARSSHLSVHRLLFARSHD